MHYTDSTDIKEQNPISTKQRPIRILHVVGGMNRGGLETWLMHVLRHIDRDRFQMDFLVHTEKPCPYDDEVRALGSRIIPCLISTSKPWLYAQNFKHILHEYATYDIIHSHVHHYSGYILRLAHKAGIPIRIAHSHIDSSPLEAKSGWFRRLYLALMKSLIARHATVGLGCSGVASEDLFGRNWKNDPRWQIFYYGIDLAPFRELIDPIKIRAQLDIPDKVFVIGHVGRFQEQKNHQFLLEIFAEVIKQDPQAYLLLVGEGALRLDIEQQALRMGIGSQVIFAGNCSDVPRLMMGAMNIFILPSLSEGLPVVSIEAQSAGLPLVLSDIITQELDIAKPLIRRVSLSKPASAWANEVLELHRSAPRLASTEWLSSMENSPFNIVSCVKALQKVYSGG
jgi:glycosyltransferase involved in cell wall biosynthesis